MCAYTRTGLCILQISRRSGTTLHRTELWTLPKSVCFVYDKVTDYRRRNPHKQVRSAFACLVSQRPPPATVPVRPEERGPLSVDDQTAADQGYPVRLCRLGGGLFGHCRSRDAAAVGDDRAADKRCAEIAADIAGDSGFTRHSGDDGHGVG